MLWWIVWLKKETEGSSDLQYQISTVFTGALVTYPPTLRTASAGVRDGEQKGIFLWLMVCLFGAVGCLPLPVEPWQCLPRTRLIWAYVELLYPALEPYLLKACQQSLSRILLCPMQHPTLQHSAPLHIAVIPECFYGPASFFTLPKTETGEISQHLRKRFDWSASRHQSRYDKSVFAGAKNRDCGGGGGPLAFWGGGLIGNGGGG